MVSENEKALEMKGERNSKPFIHSLLKHKAGQLCLSPGQDIGQASVLVCLLESQLFYQPNVLVMISTWIYVHGECIPHATHPPTPHKPVCTQMPSVINLLNMNRNEVRNKGIGVRAT